MPPRRNVACHEKAKWQGFGKGDTHRLENENVEVPIQQVANRDTTQLLNAIVQLVATMATIHVPKPQTKMKGCSFRELYADHLSVYDETRGHLEVKNGFNKTEELFKVTYHNVQ